MRALCESVEHWYHVDSREYGHYVRVSITCCVRESSPDGTNRSAEGADGEILKRAANAWMHHDPNGDYSPPALIVIPPSSTLGKPGGDREERCDDGDFESEP